MPSFFRLQALLAPILGTDLADSLVGTASDDTIQALQGNDTVLGGDGNDVISLDKGNDVYGTASLYGAPVIERAGDRARR